MKKTKILTVASVLLTMALTGCKGGKSNDTTDITSAGSQGSTPAVTTSTSTHTHVYGEWSGTEPTCTEAGVKTRTCACGDTQTQNTPALGHDFGENAQKVDVFEEDGALAEEMYKCVRCDKTQIRWSALDYDATKTAARSTNGPESRDSGKAIRFANPANCKDADANEKGCHIVYNVYIPEPIEHAKLQVFSSRRTDIDTIFDKSDGDQQKGYEYVDGELVRPDSRYGLKVDGQVVILPKDESGQEWKDGNNWYTFPGELSFAEAGVHEIELYNLGGYRAEFYNFALCGFGAHEHVDNFKVTDSKLNSDNKPVLIGTDSFNGKKAAMIELENISGAYASSKDEVAEGQPESFTLGAQDTAFKAAKTYKLDKGKVIAFKVNLSAAVTGAKLEIGAEFSNGSQRYFYNMTQHGNETNTGSNADAEDGDAWRYYTKVNDGAFVPMNCEELMQNVLDGTPGKYMPLGTFNLVEGENTIYLRQSNLGYRVTLDNPLRIIFPGNEAPVAGEHAHLYNILVSENPATCAAEGSKVTKCVCGEEHTEVLPKIAHTWGEAQTQVAGMIPHECTACHAMAYELLMENTSNSVAAQKLKTDAKWDITGIPAGNYEIQLYACAASTTLPQNMMTGDNVGRYQWKVTGGDYVDPANMTYAAAGLGTGEAADKCAWSKTVAEIAIGADAAEFVMHWTDKGYSAFIGGVRLVKAAAQN